MLPGGSPGECVEYYELVHPVQVCPLTTGVTPAGPSLQYREGSVSVCRALCSGVATDVCSGLWYDSATRTWTLTSQPLPVHYPPPASPHQPLALGSCLSSTVFYRRHRCAGKQSDIIINKDSNPNKLPYLEQQLI